MEWRIAIVDDLKMDRERLQKDVAKWYAKQGTDVEICVYDSGAAMLSEFSKDKFRIAFLDIRMDDMTGIELAEHLREEDTALLICFLTTSREYAFDAFPIHPFDYLIKPYKEEQLNHVLAEANRALSGSEPEIAVKIGKSEVKVAYSQIVSAISQGHTVLFRLTDGSVARGLLTFGETERILTADERFLLCNRGVLVNMDHVASMDGELFKMNEGSSFPLRTKNRPELIRQFSQYQITRMRRGR
jgi:DNA-binding LytR/AlgR family response regulator